VSTDLAEFVAHAAPLRGVATAVNVTDGAGAKTHVSSLVAAHFLLQRGIEPILQVTCRDRNRLALQADLLGAVALGVRNVLVLRGDEPRVGDQPDAKPVFDLATTQVLAMARDMRAERRLPSGTDPRRRRPRARRGGDGGRPDARLAACRPAREGCSRS
jgi:methylenetetrahydrofolate reductase (NADPH)